MIMYNNTVDGAIAVMDAVVEGIIAGDTGTSTFVKKHPPGWARKGPDLA
jgi:hypothetical protein